MCNLPGLGGSSQGSAAESSALRAPGTPAQDLSQRIFLNTLFGAGKSTGIGPSGTGVGGVLGGLQERLGLSTGYETPFLTERGLTTEQEAAVRTPFQQAVEQAVGQLSGNYAARGFKRPENIQAIAGSAAMNVAPRFAEMFANLAKENVAQRTEAPLVRENIKRQQFSDILAALGINVNAISGATQVSGGTTNSNLLGPILGGAAQGGSQAAVASMMGPGCLVAVELYGADALETTLARHWVHTVLPSYHMGSWVRMLYLRYGHILALLVRRYACVRRIAQRLFDRIVVDMTERLCHGER